MLKSNKVISSLKRENITVIVLKEGIEKEIEVESLFKETITENFPRLEKICIFGYKKIKDHQAYFTQITQPQGMYQFSKVNNKFILWGQYFHDTETR